MKTVTVEIIGKTPILLHWDNVEWADRMDAWKADPRNKKLGKPGDDRTPPWRWIGSCYNDGNLLTIPSENVMRCIMEGAAEVPTGRGKKTFKAQSQSGMMCKDFHWPLVVSGNLISIADVNVLGNDEFSFAYHLEAVKAMGFTLFVKRARIGQQKHIRVRPRFDNWAISGEIIITDSQITKELLQQILDVSGETKGLGDWRPGSKTPGPWGMFEAVVK
jgi:hypothetical protein